MFVVAGASGQTGRATAEALLAHHQPVTVVVRSKQKAEEWRSRGAEVALLDLADTGALASQLRGKAGAFLLIPPNYGVANYLEDRRRIVSSLAEAVRQSAIPNVVFLSSIGAQHKAGTGLILINHDGEEALRPAARNLTLLRASYFLENWSSVLPAARAKGILPSFLTPGRKMETIATRDIGRFAAESLMHPPAGLRVLEVTGPREYSPEDIAVAAGQALGKEVKLLPLPLDAAVPAFTEQGLPESTARLFAEMLGGLNSGHIAFENRAQVRRGSTTPVEVFQQIS